MKQGKYAVSETGKIKKNTVGSWFSLLHSINSVKEIFFPREIDITEEDCRWNRKFE